MLPLLTKKKSTWKSIPYVLSSNSISDRYYYYFFILYIFHVQYNTIPILNSAIDSKGQMSVWWYYIHLFEFSILKFLALPNVFTMKSKNIIWKWTNFVYVVHDGIKFYLFVSFMYFIMNIVCTVVVRLSQYTYII